MPSVQPGPGWWLASDGNWYPPTQQPGYSTALQAAQIQAIQPQAVQVQQAQPASSQPHLYMYGKKFRSKSVRSAGIFDLVIGVAITAAGIAEALRLGKHRGIPVGLAICMLGLIFMATGAGRISSYVTITETKIVWSWQFSQHEIQMRDAIDAALVEKGDPAVGGQMGLGMFGWQIIFLYMVVSALLRMVHVGASMGSHQMIIVKKYGPPVPVQPIGSWGSQSSHASASEAVAAIKAAIAVHKAQNSSRRTSII